MAQRAIFLAILTDRDMLRRVIGRHLRGARLLDLQASLAGLPQGLLFSAGQSGVVVATSPPAGIPGRQLLATMS